MQTCVLLKYNELNLINLEGRLGRFHSLENESTRRMFADILTFFIFDCPYYSETFWNVARPCDTYISANRNWFPTSYCPQLHSCGNLFLFHNLIILKFHTFLSLLDPSTYVLLPNEMKKKTKKVSRESNILHHS